MTSSFPSPGCRRSAPADFRGLDRHDDQERCSKCSPCRRGTTGKTEDANYLEPYSIFYTSEHLQPLRPRKLPEPLAIAHKLHRMCCCSLDGPPKSTSGWPIASADSQ